MNERPSNLRVGARGVVFVVVVVVVVVGLVRFAVVKIDVRGASVVMTVRLAVVTTALVVVMFVALIVVFTVVMRGATVVTLACPNDEGIR